MKPQLPTSWLALSWTEPWHWPLRLRMAALALSFVLTMLLLAPWLCWPTWQRIQALRVDASHMQEAQRRQMLSIRALEAQQSRQQLVRDTYTQAMQALGRDDELALLDVLHQRAQAHQLVEESYEPLAPVPTDCCEVQVSRWILRGTYRALRAWLVDVAELPALLRVGDLQWQIVEDSDGQMPAQQRLRVELQHYQAPERLP